MLHAPCTATRKSESRIRNDRNGCGTILSSLHFMVCKMTVDVRPDSAPHTRSPASEEIAIKRTIHTEYRTPSTKHCAWMRVNNVEILIKPNAWWIRRQICSIIAKNLLYMAKSAVRHTVSGRRFRWRVFNLCILTLLLTRCVGKPNRTLSPISRT